MNLNSSLDDTPQNPGLKEPAQAHHRPVGVFSRRKQPTRKYPVGRLLVPVHSHPHHCCEHGVDATCHHDPVKNAPDSILESLTQKRLLRLIRTIQMVEKGIIARSIRNISFLPCTKSITAYNSGPHDYPMPWQRSRWPWMSRLDFIAIGLTLDTAFVGL